MKNAKWIKGSIFGLTMLISGAVMAIAEPEYTLIKKDDDYELRHYAPMIVAETMVSGSISDASNQGFRIIADFIFGNNSLQDGTSDKIAMTAPVTVEPKSEKIDMTAPVTIQQDSGQWRVHFVMPSSYSMDSLPKPNNPQVTIREIPARRYGVLRFSGFTGEKKVADKTGELLKWLDRKGISPIGQPELARYDNPWTTLPFFRRNEIMVRY